MPLLPKYISTQYGYNILNILAIAKVFVLLGTSDKFLFMAYKTK